MTRKGRTPTERPTQLYQRDFALLEMDLMQDSQRKAAFFLETFFLQ